MASTGLAQPNETAAGHWGTYAGCDMPLRTLEIMFEQVRFVMMIEVDARTNKVSF